MNKQSGRSGFGILALVAAVLLACAGHAAANADTDAAMNDSLRRTIETFGPPGLVLSVVHKGEVIYAGGAGVAEKGSSQRVDADTLFQIGSVSKAFTAAALAVLADEGKLGWDDPVIDYLPEFRMYDPWVTREFTIRDLLTHRSGLPLGAGDLLMFPDGTGTVDDIIRAMRFFEPETSFRSTFAYDNLLYVIAGEVVARVSGMSFEDFVEQRVMQPLGMNDCVATLDRAGKRAVLAKPHVRDGDSVRKTTTRLSSIVAAAGGITCSARSMTKWMTFLLNRGVTGDGRRILSEAQFAELVRPVTLLPSTPYLAEHAGAHLSAYALGWGVSTFAGDLAWSHGGAVWGITTFIAVLPDRNLAVFASGNLLSGAPRATVYDVLNHFLAEPGTAADKDWIAILGALQQDRRAAADAVVAAAWDARAADSGPSLALEKYVGTYRDAWYGDVRIALGEDGQLRFASSRNAPLEGPMEHFQYDTFVARWTDRSLDADAYVTFSLGADGAVEGLRMKAVSPATDFSYDFHHLDLRRVANE